MYNELNFYNPVVICVIGLLFLILVSVAKGKKSS